MACGSRRRERSRVNDVRGGLCAERRRFGRCAFEAEPRRPRNSPYCATAACARDACWQRAVRDRDALRVLGWRQRDRQRACLVRFRAPVAMLRPLARDLDVRADGFRLRTALRRRISARASSRVKSSGRPRCARRRIAASASSNGIAGPGSASVCRSSLSRYSCSVSCRSIVTFTVAPSGRSMPRTTTSRFFTVAVNRSTMPPV